MSKTVSMRLTDQQLAAVEKIKRRYSQPSMSSTLQLLLEEKLREEEYGYIIFRDAAGRTAFLEGTGLAVWEVMMIARCYGYDVAKTAEHLVIREDLVRLAMEYASDHREEVYAQLAENDAMDFEALKRILPNIELFTVPADAEIESEATEAG